MVFSSYPFIFLYLPIVLTVYFLLARYPYPWLQRWFLAAASLFFYGYYNVKYLAVIGSSILINYFLALQMKRSDHGSRGKTALFVCGVLFNILLIGYFKYYDFFAESINLVFRTDWSMKNIMLPLGISFFTFQQLSFLVSIYKGEEVGAELKFDEYCVFVLFFPQLVAGPIVLYDEMMPQFKDESRRYLNPDNLSVGIYRFVIGLFKKAVIADTVAVFVDNGFQSDALALAPAWITSICYTMQIYFDFSGYSDMAIGLGKMFNINIPENFNMPYRSESISDFWRRWHITLGRALNTYIYRPLGGNRRGRIRTYVNLFVTFLVSGIWHGAAWTFVLWGVLHGLLSVLERWMGDLRARVPKAIRILLTFLVVNALWVLFRAETFHQALVVYRGMVDFAHVGISQIPGLVYDGIIDFPAIVDFAYLGGIMAAMFIMVFYCENSGALEKQFKRNYFSLIGITLVFVLALLHVSRESVFIYFNF